ncbi:MAG TPA: TatD family hydrolase [Tepidisphaeraceae bacterium]|nr:TatD family hydrolase [Tepidisphaeraceae bacterium]
MLDSHCHLTDPRLFEQLDGVLDRARQAGVSRMVTIGTDPADNAAATALCKDRPDVRCAVGIHPNYCHEIDESELARLRIVQAEPSVVALGEMGLDYHYNFADKARQRHFFEKQLELAADLKRPIIIHCREAFDDCLAVLKGFNGPVVFHCFTGTLTEGHRVIDAGYLVGFTGVVTFKKSDDIRELARIIPTDRFLVETDAPYLSPEPMRRQKVNEPSLVVHTAAMIAQVRGVGLDEIDQVTTENAEGFFGWRVQSHY